MGRVLFCCFYGNWKLSMLSLFFVSLTLTRVSLCFFYWNILFLIFSNLQVVASYFPLPQCIEGLKVMVESLFGATFHSIPLAPGESWHEDVLKLSLHHPEEVSTWMIGSVNSSRCLEKLLSNLWAISNVHNNIYVSWVCCVEYNIFYETCWSFK